MRILLLLLVVAALITATRRPSIEKTRRPSHEPTHHPSKEPSVAKTRRPTHEPTHHPSREPKTRRPTHHPSKTRYPTAMPTSNPTAMPSAKPFEYEIIITSSPEYENACPPIASNLDAFVPVALDPSICEIFSLANILGNQFVTLTDFNCTLESCLSYCNDDSQCNYAVYNPRKMTCTKSTMGQTTDAPLLFEAYNGTQAFYNSRNVIGTPFYNGVCSNNLDGACNEIPCCHWNEGERGWNDYSMGGFTGGYCGRISCKPGCETCSG